jgi:hypothetical protein
MEPDVRCATRQLWRDKGAHEGGSLKTSAVESATRVSEAITIVPSDFFGPDSGAMNVPTDSQVTLYDEELPIVTHTSGAQDA